MTPTLVHRYAWPIREAIEHLLGDAAGDCEAWRIRIEGDEVVIDVVAPTNIESQTPAGEKIRTAQGDAMEPVPVTGQPPVGTGSPANEAGKSNVALGKPKGGALAQRAGIICAEKGLWRFLAETFHASGVDSADAAATLLRAECGITSRSELDHNPDAAEIFREIESKYRLWLEGY